MLVAVIIVVAVAQLLSDHICYYTLANVFVPSNTNDNVADPQ